MAWWIRTHDGELELLLAVELRGERARTDLAPDDAVAAIGRLASDPRHLSVLRDVYLQLGTNTGGSVSDFIIVPSLFDAVYMGRVVVRWKAREAVRSERVTSEPTDEVVELAALADLAAPAPEPAALAPAIVHQIRILRSASDSAAPLAEECECE